ncbi:Hsp20/alpha crystallin family protein [Sporolituus thermophilus]|uniref:Heat shock protein Hsp20 n=1 Tax=Sporolituus thermophilus DSM 23256 TaxID=1123285 RepID=A0A1G7K6B2_9FIRM|nr:Hsp20/alpha crystallin family protein [Sporolituus thermophilus]SDF32531.1 heat shock protein Hsp20 [Sporolituus thermophilus DSM 23256]
MFGLPHRNGNLPAAPRDYFNQIMRSFFDHDFLAPFENIAALTGSFRVDLRETENEYIIEADLPGVKKEDITLRYENNYLTIAAQRNETQEVKEENYVRKERRFGQLQRSFYVDNVIEDQISAKFTDGVLTVTLPKKDKNERRRSNIPIQ